MKFIVKILINALAVAIAAYFIPRVELDSFYTALVVAVALGVINTFIKPIVNIFALPINLLTLGLFSIVINAAFILLVSRFVEGFEVGDFVTAIIFSLVLSLTSSILGILAK
ncbi:MAG: phage holin family protein [bacterium]|nr:phage holin family protein [bacterium]